jgi:hypothetical protein
VRAFNGQSSHKRLLANPSDAPNGAASVVGDEEGAVIADGDANGLAPKPAILCYETTYEVIVFATGVAIAHRGENDLVAGVFGTVPSSIVFKD